METVISFGGPDSFWFNGACARPIRTNTGDLYLVALDNNNDVFYWKSTDGGITWSSSILVFTGTAVAVAAWHDHETGYAGDILHIAYIETATDDVLYRPLDTSTDTLGTQTTIFAGATAGSSDIGVSIVRARGGNLYCAYDIDSGTETGFARSVDNGANWVSRTDLHEASSGNDQIILCPGFAADNQDIFAIFWDISANEISRKNYDDSANSWAETSIATSMAETSGVSIGTPGFSIAVDLINSRIILVAWSAPDLANADLRCWFITDAAITETAANVVLNSTDDQGLCTVGYDAVRGHIYVFYCGKSDGSETAATAWNTYYKISTDDGATWSAEAAVGYFSAARRWIGCPQKINGSRGWVLIYDLQFIGNNILICILPTPIYSQPSVLIGV